MSGSYGSTLGSGAKPALAPASAPVDARELPQLMCMVSELAQLFNFTALDGSADGDWRAFSQRWDKLKHTSVAGLRETFLMRAGTLVTHEGNTTLNVPHKTVDILKQSLPWQHRIIKSSWIATPLFVNWS